MTIASPIRHAPSPPSRHVEPFRPGGLPWVLAAELGASLLGFAAMVHLARRLGPTGFARFEYASAVAAWLLVVVRGGVDTIVYREAARRPSLIGPLTNALIGLRCALAVLAYAVVLALAALVGRERGGVVAIAGLLLFPSAWVADVGLRASGRLRAIALAQVLRASGYAAFVLVVVNDPGALGRAAWAPVVGETLGALVPLSAHSAAYGWPRPRFRRRAWTVLAHRGAIAGLIRFGRVSLYAADLLALGWWTGPELGPYAAARRLVFALIALGLTVPATMAPALARAWAAGASGARRLIEETLGMLLAVSLAATVGLMIAAELVMPLLFGARFRYGGPWLVLIAARLPALLAASFIQAALVACRRETWVLDQTAGLILLALALVPFAAARWGPWGVGWAVLGIELVAAYGGSRMLARLGLSPRWGRPRGGFDL